ncbi:hypothetical protein [Streptoalloteichus hindustanus]|uniref:Uncharacterized protein n=1 Tax=Streptoalloteichus hindustanus TaxID=2017 RepID=A0A1M4TT63_STRHI|nr:hypothetical protein [Streptoalloteichus hindustanus]SHE47661.1 hypothetical protein SAMN05444320_101189 [Streptoalloteichus hindustanus]
MRVRVRYVAAWLTVTACAVALSWLGVRSVFGVTLPQRFDLHAGLAAPTHTVVLATPEAPTSSPPPSPTPTATATPAAHTTTAAPTTSSARRTTTERTTPAPPPLPHEGTWVWEGGRPVYLRSFRLHGGDAGVRFGEGGVDAVSATPGKGYSAQVERQRPDLVVITFRSAGGTSRLEATWTGGPYWRVTETAG